MLKISIITVTYNAEKHLSRCISSVISQKNVDLEYIIIDGGSTDGTLDIINSFKNYIDYRVSEKDKGIYDALNKGLKVAKGDVIGFLHADDYFVDNQVLQDVVYEFKRLNIDIIYGNIRYVKNTVVYRDWKSNIFDRKAFLYGWMPPHTGMFCRKKVYEICGNFLIHFKISADYEFMLRSMYFSKIPSAYLDRYIVHMEVGGTSNVSLKAKGISLWEDYKAWIENGMYLTLAPILKPLRKLGQFL